MGCEAVIKLILSNKKNRNSIKQIAHTYVEKCNCCSGSGHNLSDRNCSSCNGNGII